MQFFCYSCNRLQTRQYFVQRQKRQKNGPENVTEKLQRKKIWVLQNSNRLPENGSTENSCAGKWHYSLLPF